MARVHPGLGAARIDKQTPGRSVCIFGVPCAHRPPRVASRSVAAVPLVILFAALHQGLLEVQVPKKLQLGEALAELFGSVRLYVAVGTWGPHAARMGRWQTD